MQSDKSFYNTRTTNKIQKNIYSFFPTGLPASHFWNLMLSIALFSALTWENVEKHYEVKPTELVQLTLSILWNTLLITYIGSGLESVPNTSRSNARVVDVGQASSSPEGHREDVVEKMSERGEGGLTFDHDLTRINNGFKSFIEWASQGPRTSMKYVFTGNKYLCLSFSMSQWRDTQHSLLSYSTSQTS